MGTFSVLGAGKTWYYYNRASTYRYMYAPSHVNCKINGTFVRNSFWAALKLHLANGACATVHVTIIHVHYVHA